jgi:hypothetical protein
MRHEARSVMGHLRSPPAMSKLHDDACLALADDAEESDGLERTAPKVAPGAKPAFPNARKSHVAFVKVADR